jgi:N-acetyl-gamma-glutamyl-phosphate reductase
MKKKVAIVGASGYSGEELLRLLLRHPHADLAAVTSRQYAGQTVAQVFPKFAGHPHARTVRFNDPNAELLAKQAEIVFLALPHGVAAEYAVPLLQLGCQVIDLSADFRLKSATVYREFYGRDHPAPELLDKSVYGLPEVYRDRIRNAQLIAAPGCYPTSILLPALPLLRQGLIKATGMIADSLSGVSGAGRKLETDYLFVECNESVRPYGVPRHRHLSEIEQELSLAAKLPVALQFTPHLIPVNRGILTTLYLAPAWHFESGAGAPPANHLAGGTGIQSAAGSTATSPSETTTTLKSLAQKIDACYQSAYADEPFVRLLDGQTLPDTKNVVGTNVIEIAWRLDPRTGRLIVMSALDNIVKGASGQAVQCFNILCDVPETAGLL